MMYTIGSAGFFIAPIIMLKVNFSERMTDPLARYHNSITGIFTERKLAHLQINFNTKINSTNNMIFQYFYSMIDYL